ncbi:MAG: hypothetical protein LQ348_005972 [Seirophora lacunosa]|nr:MAG: hypothetical protein LQ348_005972 [Seirophora lacunosa]
MPPKRKQTPDMPQSPPKRVTRARAKKDIDSKPETTHIMTPSAKASTKKRITAQPAKVAKPKNEDTQPVDAEMTEEVIAEKPIAEPAKTRAKAKATTSTVAKKPNQPSNTAAPAKSTRSCSSKATVTTSDNAQLSKPKGRPKRTVEPVAPAVPEVGENDEDAQVPSKVARGRPAAVVTKPPSTRAKAAAAVPKKRVKFDDQAEQDKENQPMPLDPQKLESKPTGLRAKPIRKPATAKGAMRNTKASTRSATTEDHGSKQDILPLSPKKVTQVAKTPSVGSEDELVGVKTPPKILSKSPSKALRTVDEDTNPTSSELPTNQGGVPESPRKDASPRRLSTSPRKPPPSPFKDALKDSPRKIDLGSRPPQPKFDAPSSPSKSPLKEAPKRVNFGDSSRQPILQWSKTPIKSSLLQSPARRPGGSAMKSSSILSPSRDFGAAPSMFKMPSTSTVSAASSPLRAAKSPEKPPKVHDLIKENRLADLAGAPAGTPSNIHQVESLTSSPELKVSMPSSERHDNSQNLDEDTTLDLPQAEVAPELPSSLDLGDHSTHEVSGIPVIHDDDLDSDVQQANVAQAHTPAVEVDVEPTPTEFPKSFTKPSFVLSSSVLADRAEESESEDELASPQKLVSPSPLKNFGISAKDFGTPSILGPQKGEALSGENRRASTRRRSQRNSVAMTPLAMQMSSWLASSPEKKSAGHVSHRRSVFSPVKPIFAVQETQLPSDCAFGSPSKQNFFDDEMAVRDTEDAAEMAEEPSIDELQYDDGHPGAHASQESQTSETYGDENAVPCESTGYVVNPEEDNPILTCTPAKVFDQYSREIHTVSKVPLRPAADDTPLAVTRKRSRSLAGPLSDISLTDRLSIGRDSILSPIFQDNNLPMSMLPGDATAWVSPETPTNCQKSLSNTPVQSFRKAGYSTVLKGAVVHVDVHTTEGADASGIFIDLLTQMGARCVKQWHWNPQGSLSSNSEGSTEWNEYPEAGTPGAKLGITHVVYKDGGKRTLEKVREAKGAVLCVGVGWVLDCEREDRWLNEADYAVDTSIIPRGGSRRRKSMEPRALANLNGCLVPAETPLKATPAVISPTKEFLAFDTPISRRETFEFKTEPSATPGANGPSVGELDDNYDSPLSPTTPYYLSKGAKLVQQTCPPKQTQELFFPLTGRIEDQPNEVVRQRLLAARRKSLQWASKVQSPLGRTVSYGK